MLDSIEMAYRCQTCILLAREMSFLMVTLLSRDSHKNIILPSDLLQETLVVANQEADA
jgi:hypothetical protein